MVWLSELSRLATDLAYNRLLKDSLRAVSLFKRSTTFTLSMQ